MNKTQNETTPPPPFVVLRPYNSRAQLSLEDNRDHPTRRSHAFLDIEKGSNEKREPHYSEDPTIIISPEGADPKREGLFVDKSMLERSMRRLPEYREESDPL